MIKGINKQILEVTNPESKYFEKVIFFVTPEGQNTDDGVLKAEAEKITRNFNRPPRQRRTTKQKIEFVALAIMGVGAGIALSLLLNYFIA